MHIGFSVRFYGCVPCSCGASRVPPGVPGRPLAQCGQGIGCRTWGVSNFRVLTVGKSGIQASASTVRAPSGGVSGDGYGGMLATLDNRDKEHGPAPIREA